MFGGFVSISVLIRGYVMGADTKTCKYCQSLVPKKASVCPHCRKTIGTTSAVKGCLTIIVGFFLIAMCTGAMDTDTNTSTSTKKVTPKKVTAPKTRKVANKWYAGGNLHGKLGSDWVDATYNNRLATSADFVVSVTPEAQKFQLFENNELPLKERAFGLEVCISETTKEEITMNMEISEIAAACIILMGYQ